MPSRESQTDRQRINVAGPTALGDAIAWTRRYAADQALAEHDQARLCIIVEELVTNLCEHGVCEGDREIGIELARDGSCLGLAIEDNGRPFDPRTAPHSADIPTRGGGAGLNLVRSWAEIVEYESGNGRNRLELRLRLSDG
ncbi:ATP-binding protein [Sphingomonas sp.]|uniref:ATP-binding protein n=1 Tax=Sphingomonas sp. TaxID=28214 RepID=UPI0025D1F89E|nr:ATP-binding protein [Sphingomonas sp.]